MVSQRLGRALPSYNYPRGLPTARMPRPATLRGLADQCGARQASDVTRRRWSRDTTVGRGASAVDLNTIPTAMVQSIEVLRDGASHTIRIGCNRREIKSAFAQCATAATWVDSTGGASRLR
jgi:hypothetical protein